jgi:hypothetical protein
MYHSKNGGFKVYSAQDYSCLVIFKDVPETAYTCGGFSVPYGYRMTRKRYGVIWYLQVALAKNESSGGGKGGRSQKSRKYIPLYIARPIGEANLISVKNRDDETVRIRAKKAIIIRKSPSALASAIVGEWNKARKENNIAPVSNACSGVRMFGWHDKKVQRCFVNDYSSKESEEHEEPEKPEEHEELEVPKEPIPLPRALPVIVEPEEISETIDIDDIDDIEEEEEDDLSAPVKEWSVNRVKRWVEEDPHTADISGCFRDQYITGCVLIQIRNEGQLKEIGITQLGKRYHMLERIKLVRRLHAEEEAESRKPTSAKRKQHARKDDSTGFYVKRSGFFQRKNKKQKTPNPLDEQKYQNRFLGKPRNKSPVKSSPTRSTSSPSSTPLLPPDRKLEEERHRRGLRAKESRMRRMRQFRTATIHPESFVGEKIKVPKNALDRKEEIDRILRIVTNTNDPFEILGVSSICSDEAVRLAYKGRTRYVHPDKNPSLKERSNEAFNALTRAKDVILNQRKALDNPGFSSNVAESVFATFMNGKGNGVLPTYDYTDNYPFEDFDEHESSEDDELLI